ncbi:MAG: SpoVR family protein [Firmicutes bacterium]|nr:SpoVR family protein [Bacillota bacterium]
MSAMPLEPLPPRFQEVLDQARSLGLDFFELRFEVVPEEIMAELAAYGLPTRAQHWSYGQVYNRNRLFGRMGLSRIYEIVLNNDPAHAFLLETNRPVENLLVVAHVAAHADFFKNNALFQETNRHMVAEAAAHAQRIDRYREEVGEERVEHVMDIAMALEQHIDFPRGVHRRRYEEERGRRPAASRPPRDPDEERLAELFPEEEAPPERETAPPPLPPHPERDLLWFLANYAPLTDWERDILEIQREESYYFYPQFATKILNEGWATYWHARILGEAGWLTPEETLEYARLHAAVVQPGSRLQINPYYLGYRILRDVEEQSGPERLWQLRREEDDVSLIQNFLTPELADEMELFTYGPRSRFAPSGREPELEVKSRDIDQVREFLCRPRYNYGVPLVAVSEVRHGQLYLEQLDRHVSGLDLEYAKKTLEYIGELWRGPVRLVTADSEGRELELVWEGQEEPRRRGRSG